MSSSITVGGNLHSLRKTSVISPHTSHFLSFVAEGRHNITLWRRECPCFSVIHSSWTGIHLKCWPWPKAFLSCCRPGELTSYWLLLKECQCHHGHWFLSSGPPFVACLECTKIFVSASSCVQRTSSSRSFVRLLVKIILIAIIYYTLNVYEKHTAPFILLTSSLQLTWLQFSHFLNCRCLTQCPSSCAWQSVPVLWRTHKMWHMFQISLSSLVTEC